MADDLYGSESMELEGVGTLKQLTLSQLADLRFSIRNDLAAMATQGLTGEDKSTAMAAIAVQVGGMTDFQQATAVINAPMLLAEAVKHMSGSSDGLVILANKIPAAKLNDVKLWVLKSYGYDLGPKASSPPTESTAKKSPATSRRSTSGRRNESAG